MTWAANGIVREKRSREFLMEDNKKFTIQDFIAILRDHGNNSQWKPDRGPGGTLCLHAGNPLLRRTQTVCSLVAGLGEKNQFYYTTGASNPCLSPYFPLFVGDTEVPKEYKEGSASYNRDAYWWESEYYHRKALKYFNSALTEIQLLINSYEKEMFSDIEDNNIAINQDVIDSYFIKARSIVRDWGNKLEKLPSEKTNCYYSYYWHKYNKRNGIKY